MKKPSYLPPSPAEDECFVLFCLFIGVCWAIDWDIYAAALVFMAMLCAFMAGVSAQQQKFLRDYGAWRKEQEGE